MSSMHLQGSCWPLEWLALCSVRWPG